METKPNILVTSAWPNKLANLLYKPSGVDPYPHWECGSGSRWGKNDPQKYKREEISYSEVLNVLHGGQGKINLNFS
jgi:hypothetical protein